MLLFCYRSASRARVRLCGARERREDIYICITYGVCDIGTCIFSRGPRYSARNAAAEVERERRFGTKEPRDKEGPER